MTHLMNLSKYLLLITLPIVLSLFEVTFGDEFPLYGYENDTLNLVTNGNFENQDPLEGWTCHNAICSANTTDYHRGQTSILISERQPSVVFAGLRHKMFITEGGMFYASCFIKTIQTRTAQMFYDIKMFVKYKEVLVDNTFNTVNVEVGRLVHLRAESGSYQWRQLGGDIDLRNKNLKFVLLWWSLNTPEQQIDYLIDSVSLIRIPEDPNWEAKADASILEHRTDYVTLSSTLPSSVAPCQVEFEVNQVKSHTKFGSVVHCETFTNNPEYQNFLLTNFESSSLANALKWKPSEPIQGLTNFDRPDDCITIMAANNISVRGHSVVWNNPNNLPSWVVPLRDQEMIDALQTRTNTMVGHYAGQMYEWDVVNELSKNDFLQEASADPLIVDRLHNWTAAADPNTKICTNDFRLLRAGDYTSALVDIHKLYESRGTAEDCMGIQSHLKDHVPVEILRHRLRILASTNAYLSITEMSAHSTNVTTRKQILVEALKIFFSQPKVSSINLWHPVNDTTFGYEPDNTLLFDDYQTPNIAGQAYLDLRASWRTTHIFNAQSQSVDETFRAFHGWYDVKTTYKGITAKHEKFYFHPGSNVTINLTLNEEDFSNIESNDHLLCL